MLFLFLASFYLSLRARTRVDYIFIVAFLTIMLSFFSTAAARTYRVPLVYPLGILSFPFSSSLDWTQRPPPLEEYISSYNIQFLTVKIWSFPWYDVTRFWAFSVFPFYLFVNAVGVTLGYWMNKRLVDEPLKRELFDFFFRAGLISISVLYIINVITLKLTPNDFPIHVTLFSMYFFWVPALIATLVYGIRKWPRNRKHIP